MSFEVIMKKQAISIIILCTVLCIFSSSKAQQTESQSSWEKQNMSVQVAQLEYHITFDHKTSTLQSPNRAQGLRSRYLPNQWIIESRNPNQPNRIKADIKFLGVESDLEILSSETEPNLITDKNALVQDYGSYQIEYNNSPEGIKQSIVVQQDPSSEDQLKFHFSLEGLTARFSEEVLHFYDENGSLRLSYDELIAFDAVGRTLPLKLELSDNNWIITVSEQGCTYPVTLDPTIKNADISWSAHSVSDSMKTGFGASLNSYYGSYCGAPFFDNGQFNEGVILNVGGTSPSIYLQSDHSGALFGSSMSYGSVNGDSYDDLLVGAPGYSNGQASEGAMYLYYGLGLGYYFWVPYYDNSKLDIIESNKDSAQLGSSVHVLKDFDGDGYGEIVGGAPKYTNGQNDEGAVYFMYGDSSGVDTSRIKILESNKAKSNYGYSLTSADFNYDGFSELIVGAPNYENGQLEEGGVFVYYGSSSGLNATSFTLLESNRLRSNFGKSIANGHDINGDGYEDLLIGSPSYSHLNSGNWIEGGGVFIFYGGVNGFSVSNSDTLLSDDYNLRFGDVVEGLGDRNYDGYAEIAVLQKGKSWPYYSLQHLTKISIYKGSQTGPDTSNINEINHPYAFNIEFSTWQLLVASQNDTNSAYNTIYFYNFNNKGDVRSHYSQVFWNSENHNFNCSAIGDVDGDNNQDIMVYMSYYDFDIYGKNHIHLGSDKGFREYSDWMQYTYNVGNYKYEKAGDVNGDSLDDMLFIDPGLVGIVDDYKSHMIRGVAYHTSFLSHTTLASKAGDVNGDGYDDIIIAGDGLRLYTGSSNGIDTTYTNWIKDHNKVYQHLEFMGDLNHDGFDDIAALVLDTASNENELYFYLGHAGGIDKTKRILFYKDSTKQITDISLVGDLNNDNLLDLAIGFTDTLSNEEVWVCYGDSAGYDSAFKTLVRPNMSSTSFAKAISHVDVNEDGIADLAIGAPDYDAQGEVFVYLGSNGELEEHPDFKLVKKTGIAPMASDFKNYGSSLDNIDSSGLIINDDSALVYGNYFAPNPRGVANVLRFQKDDLSSISSASNTTIIQGCDSIVYHNTTYFRDTIFWLTKDTFYDVIGLEVVMLKIIHSKITHIDTSVCELFVTETGVEFTSSGIFEQTFQTSSGCDSIVYIHINILQSDDSLISVEACELYVSNTGKIWRSSGIYSDSFINILGCDSIVNYNLTIRKSTLSEQSLTACAEVKLHNGATVTNSGTYADTLLSKWGCDSIIVQHVTIHKLDRTVPPSSLTTRQGKNAHFIVKTDSLAESIQWQSNLGFGFDDLFDAGQYDGVNTDSLTVMKTTYGNNRQVFRCIVSKQSCKDTTQVAILHVVSGAGIESLHDFSKVTVYPNPTQNRFFIMGLDKKEIERLILIDTYSKSYEVSIHDNLSIELPNAAGMYVLRIKLHSGEEMNFRVLKI